MMNSTRDRWLSILGEFRSSHHNVRDLRPPRVDGLAGRGSSSYIDAVIMRDRDANAGWTAASDATLEERRHYCQNWRADVVALLSGDGAVSEWVRYSAYGEATVYPFVNGDYNADGGVDGDDVTAFLTDQDNNVSAADVDRSGEVDGDDVTAFYASWDEGWMSTAWTSGGGLPSNAGQLSVTSGNRIGYAGYQFDPATEQYHVRHRVYSPEMGRWTRRDPIGYVNAMGLYGYCSCEGLSVVDYTGLCIIPCGKCVLNLIPAGRIPKILKTVLEYVPCLEAAACLIAHPGEPDKCSEEIAECAAAVGLDEGILKTLLDKIFTVKDCIECLGCLAKLVDPFPFEDHGPMSPPDFVSCQEVCQSMRDYCETRPCPRISERTCKSRASLRCLECKDDPQREGEVDPTETARLFCEDLGQWGACQLPDWCRHGGDSEP